MLDKLGSGMSYSVLAGRSKLKSQQYTLNKVSLNRNTHRPRLCID